MSDDEIRVMVGMTLMYEPEGYHAPGTLLTVKTVTRRKQWSTVKLIGWSGNPRPGGAWASSEYNVRFPDHVVRPPFRRISARDVMPKLQSCDHHATHDDEGEPTGPPCGAPATHIIHWPTERRWSLACEAHIHPDEFDDEAPPRVIKELP